MQKNEKITTNFEPIDDSDAINRAYLVSKLLKSNGQMSLLGKDCNKFKLQYNKQSVEEVLIQRAVKTTFPTLYDKGLFDNFQNGDKVWEDFLFTTRRREDLEEVNDIIHWFC